MLNTNDSGLDSLRQAILDANATPGFDTINFNIPGTGVHTIQPVTGLPALSDSAGVLIDGYSQPGASQNTLTTGSNAVLEIELDGSLAGPGASGLTVNASNNSIQGLVINRFNSTNLTIEQGSFGIPFTALTDNRVEGNFIGTNAAGNAAAGNSNAGIFLRAHVDGTTIINNVISGHSDGTGVWVITLDEYSTTIQGNVIGTDATGQLPLPNSCGVLVWRGEVMIGGTGAEQGNIIAFNTGSGLVRSIPTSSHITIARNSIHENGGPGIEVHSNSTVTANEIAYNGGPGVTVYFGASNVLIEENTINGNGYGTAVIGEFLTLVDGNGPGVWVLGNSLEPPYNSGIATGPTH